MRRKHRVLILNDSNDSDSQFVFVDHHHFPLGDGPVVENQFHRFSSSFVEFDDAAAGNLGDFFSCQTGTCHFDTDFMLKMQQHVRGRPGSCSGFSHRFIGHFVLR